MYLENVILILVGNKCDVKEGRQVTTDEAFECASEFSMELPLIYLEKLSVPYFEVSGKTDSLTLIEC